MGPEQVIQRLADAKQQIDFGHSIFPQWIAYQFLDSPTFSSHIEKLRQELKSKSMPCRRVWTNCLDQKYLSIRLKAGFTYGAKWISRSMTIVYWKNRLKGVAFVPGSVLSSQSGAIRFTFGRGEEEVIREGIKRFARALESLE